MKLYFLFSPFKEIEITPTIPLNPLITWWALPLTSWPRDYWGTVSNVQRSHNQARSTWIKVVYSRWAQVYGKCCLQRYIDTILICRHSRLYNQWRDMRFISIYAKETTFFVHWSAWRVPWLNKEPWPGWYCFS